MKSILKVITQRNAPKLAIRLTLLSVLISFPLYSHAQTVYTFTNAGATGRTGPTQTQVDSAYGDGNTLNGYVTINTQGIQEWTVPVSGQYKIRAAGAEGGDKVDYIGNGGEGIILESTQDLTAGEVLKIVVGQQGGRNETTYSGGGGGGGGSFVYRASDNLLYTAAGGGGGIGAGNSYRNNGRNASNLRTSGTNQQDYDAGNATYTSNVENGYGGDSYGNYAKIGDYDSGGGAGWLSNGKDGKQYPNTQGGRSKANNWEGGNVDASRTIYTAEGGFGGGGAASDGGGGGGGYTGGNGGRWNDVASGGGGGASYVYGDENPSSLGTNTGHGEVVITLLTTPPTVTTDSAGSISTTTAVLHGRVSNQGDSTVTKRGFLYSSSASVTFANATDAVASNDSVFSESLTGLDDNTTYYYKSYAISAVDTSYGTELSFTTDFTAPSMTTAEASDVLSRSAVLGGEIINEGSGNVTETGVVYSTSSNPTVDDTKTSMSSGQGSFSQKVFGLSPSTTYYVRTYAVSSDSVTYASDERTFSTNAGGGGSASTYTFTNAGAASVNPHTGPTQSQVNTAYSGTSLDGAVTITTTGIQEWTVPASGMYRFQLKGGQGGTPNGVNRSHAGEGAVIYADLNLTQGDVLKIVVGQEGKTNPKGSSSNGGGFGGGGSFVWINGQSTPLIVAGGGGGASIRNTSHDVSLTYGKNGNTARDGLPSHTGQSNFGSGDGGGDGNYTGFPSKGWSSMYTNNAFTGQAGGYWIAAGGFGGGGSAIADGSNNSTASYHAGGGGGGYSGGGAGKYGVNAGGNLDGRNGGGGGGSYITSTATNVSTSDGKYDGVTTFNGASITNLGSYNSGNGEVVITLLALPPTVSALTSSGLGPTGVTVGATVAEKDYPVTDYGVVYSTSTAPTTADTKESVGSGSATFSQAITGLTEDQTYYMRAYAISNGSTFYGEELEVVTPASGPYFGSTAVSVDYTEGDGRVALHEGLTLSHDLGTQVDSVVVTVGSGYQADEDSLVVTDQSGIVSSWDGSSGRLTLTGAAAASSYQAALRTLGYVNDSEMPSEQDREVTLVAYDVNDVATPTLTVTVSVDAVNDPPSIAVNTGATLLQGESVVVLAQMLADGDPDDEGSGVIYTLKNAPNHGELARGNTTLRRGDSFTASDLGAGEVRYTHGGRRNGSDLFIFELSDGGEDGAKAITGKFTFTITLDDIAPPTISKAAKAYTENQAVGATLGTVEVTDQGAITSMEVVSVTGTDGQDYTGSYAITTGGELSVTSESADAVNNFEVKPNRFTVVVSATDEAGNESEPTSFFAKVNNEPGDADEDGDGDGVNDVDDAFPDDPSETTDTDGDGVGDNADTDDDGDGVNDADEAAAGLDPLSVDTDGNGVGDGAEDSDGDGLSNAVESEATSGTITDTDGDGVSDVVEDNAAPVLQVTGGGEQAPTSFEVTENTLPVYDFDASESGVRFALAGADAGLFVITSGGGVMRFVTAPDYETSPGPFQVEVLATDAANNVRRQAVTVTVGNVNEAGVTVVVTDGLLMEAPVPADSLNGAFTVVLASRPTAPVEIPLSSTDPSEGMVQSRVRFDGTDWNVPKEVVVTMVDDLDGDGAENFSIVTGTPVTNDPEYGTLSGQDIADASMTTQNDDPPGIAVEVLSAPRSSESGDTVRIGFRLLSQPRAVVQIPVSVDDDGEGAILVTGLGKGVGQGAMQAQVLRRLATHTVEIAPDAWDDASANQVLLVGVDDEDVDGDMSYNLVPGDPVSEDVGYNDLVAEDVAMVGLLNEDNEVDTDGDGIADPVDTDDDGDGVPDSQDAFPLDPTEDTDTDGDGVGDNADTDDDGDGVPDSEDGFPKDPTESGDADGDGIGDSADPDRDGDGVPNGQDAFPDDPAESADTDGDGVGNNADTDDDGDGVPDSQDAFPLDATESSDADGDGVGDNADPDADGDGLSNAEEAGFGTDPTNPDTDGDGVGDEQEIIDGTDPLAAGSFVDTDGDGVPDAVEQDDGTDPNDGGSFKDTDGDGVSDYAQVRTDTDGDGVPDATERSQGTDPNNADSFRDSDGDGVPDYVETFQGTDPTDGGSFRDTDGDGDPDYVEGRNGTDPTNKNDFTDADGDGVPDSAEARQGTDPNDAESFLDSDGDGVPDVVEQREGADPNDPNSVSDVIAPSIVAEQSFTYGTDRTADQGIGQIQAQDGVGVVALAIDSVVADDSVDVTAQQWFGYEGSQLTMTAAGVGSAANSLAEAPNRFTLYVRALDAAGNSSATATVRLSLAASVAAVTPGVPADSATLVQVDPLVLKWSGDAFATHYHVQVSADTFRTVMVADTLTETSASINGLAYESTYHWRVRAANAYSTGPWSAPHVFTTELTPVARVGLILPAQNAVDVEIPTTFSWHPVQEAERYEFMLFTDAMLTTVIQTHTTDTTLTIDTLQANTNYLYRVRAKNATSVSAWTNHEFTTAVADSGVVTSSEGGDALPEHYDLSQNYPNPFNPTTTIRYALPQSSQVSLEVYDMLGRRVATLVEGPRAAGYHTAIFDGSALASGVYIYRLRATNQATGQPFIQTRTLVLMK